MFVFHTEKNCHLLDHCTYCVWMEKDLHVHAYFDLLSTHNADHYFISVQIMALTILPISIIDWSDGQCIADRNNLLFVSYSGNLSISEFVWFPCSFSYSWTNTHRRAYKKQIPCFPSDLMACHTRSFCLWLQQKFVHIHLDILLKKLSIVSVNLCLSQNASSAQKQQLTEGKNHDHITICDSRNPVRYGDHCAPWKLLLDDPLQNGVCGWVDGRCRLIKDQYLVPSEENTCKAEELPLTSAPVFAVIAHWNVRWLATREFSVPYIPDKFIWVFWWYSQFRLPIFTV